MRAKAAQVMVSHWLGRLIAFQYATAQDTTLEKTVRCYPDLYHEVFNEPERAEVLTTWCGWNRTRSAG